MALEITGTIELQSGLVINSAYARVNPQLRTSGDKVDNALAFWVSETDYNEGKWPLEYNPNIQLRFDYNRTTDGTDLLSFSNEKIKTELEGKGFSVVITEL